MIVIPRAGEDGGKCVLLDSVGVSIEAFILNSCYYISGCKLCIVFNSASPHLRIYPKEIIGKVSKHMCIWYLTLLYTIIQ